MCPCALREASSKAPAQGGTQARCRRNSTALPAEQHCTPASTTLPKRARRLREHPSIRRKSVTKKTNTLTPRSLRTAHRSPRSVCLRSRREVNRDRKPTPVCDLRSPCVSAVSCVRAGEHSHPEGSARSALSDPPGPGPAARSVTASAHGAPATAVRASGGQRLCLPRVLHSTWTCEHRAA